MHGATLVKIERHCYGKIVVIAVLMLLLGCGGKTRVRTPTVVNWQDEQADQLGQVFEPRGKDIRSVSHPPPAALPEVVPDAPDDRAVWVDGYWRWAGTQWVWLRGGWVHLQAGDRMYPARFWYTAEGGMRFAERRYMDGRDQELKRPAIIKAAATPSVARLAEESTLP